MTIAEHLADLLDALETEGTPVRALSYDIPSGTLSVCDESGVVIASGTTVADVYSQLHP